jgi:hypothetical protein
MTHPSSPEPQTPSKQQQIKGETIVVLAVFSVVSLILSWVLYIYHIRHQAGDGAFAAQVLSNFRDHTFMTSTLSTSMLNSIKEVWYRSAEHVCAMPLLSETNAPVLTVHLYLISYVFLPLVRIIDAHIIIAAVQAISYSSVLLFTYLFSRDRKLSIPHSLLMLLLVAQHPLWTMGLLGQFYFNQLFLPLIAAVIWIITRWKINFPILSVFLLLTISVNEIYGIAVATVLVGRAFLSGSRQLRLLGLGIACGLVSFILISHVQSTVGDHSTQTSFVSTLLSPNRLAAIEQILGNAWTEKSLVFLLVNFLGLGIAILLTPKYVLVISALIVPNLIVSIGGAEKTGWSTHYHIAYFVPLVWLSVLSISKINLKHPSFSASIIIALLVSSSFIDLGYPGFKSDPDLRVLEVVRRTFAYSQHYSEELAYRQSLKSTVNPNDMISAPEAALYNFVDHRIFYYPMNVDIVDKVIFSFDSGRDGDNRFRSVNYGHQDDNLDDCIIPRMRENGFDFDNPVIVHPWAIVGKKP